MGYVTIFYTHRMTHPTDTPSANAAVTDRDAVVIDVIKEDVAVGKRLVETGRVEIAKTVTTEDVSLRLERLEHGVDVERRAVNEVFDDLPAGTVELDDGTTVYRIIREVPVVVTRYEVVEEILVRPARSASDEEVTVPVRTESVDVRRVPAAPIP